MSFEFVSDRPVLDFLATIAERGTTDEEKLAAPADLVAWAAESGLASDVPAPTAAQLAAAIALREAMYRLLGASLDGTAPARPDRERVNAAARRPPLAPQLSATGELTRTGTVDALLATLAGDCLELLGSDDRDLLRRCADARCTRLFVDRSRGRRRRWCDMKGCGDRAKAASYRQRRRTRDG